MFSFFIEPIRRIFREAKEQVSDRPRKRSYARMIPVDSETEGPEAKRFHLSKSSVLPRVSAHLKPNYFHGSHEKGNCVQDWFMKIGQMAAKPVIDFSLGQAQANIDYFDEDVKDDADFSFVIPNERKKGKKHQSALNHLTREPLPSANRWRAIANDSELSWNGTWDKTYERTGEFEASSDGSVRRKQKSKMIQVFPENEEASSDENSHQKSLYISKKLRKLKRLSGKGYKTPLESIRLDEKEKYRLLLEQCKVGNQLESNATTSRKQTAYSSASSNGSTAYNGYVNKEKISNSSRSNLTKRLQSIPFSNGIKESNVDRNKMYQPTKYLSLKTQEYFYDSSRRLAVKPPTMEKFVKTQNYDKSPTECESPVILKQETGRDFRRRPSSEDSGRSTEHSSSKDTLIRRNTVPTFERAVFSKEWMKDLQVSLDECLKARTEKQDVLEKQTRQFREKREAKIFAENRKSLHRLKKSLNLKSPEASEEEDETSKLPELTPDMERKIEEALRPNPGEEVLCEAFRLSIARRDMETLSGLNWLNDEIINFYMNLLMERGKNDNFPACYAFNTFFYPKLIAGGHNALKRWTRKVDIFSHDFILIPVHLGMHWCLAVIDFPQKKIQYYDSMGGQNNECVNALRTYLQDESKDKKKKEYDMSDWKLETVKNIPQQMNGSDCGMFTLKYAEYITRNAKITFSQRHMPYFRRRMVYEIVTKTLL